jgi:hypothetical protein
MTVVEQSNDFKQAKLDAIIEEEETNNPLQKSTV